MLTYISKYGDGVLSTLERVCVLSMTLGCRVLYGRPDLCQRTADGLEAMQRNSARTYINASYHALRLGKLQCMHFISYCI